MYLSPFTDHTIPGIEQERASTELVALTYAQEQGWLPATFPMSLWTAQANRYRNYWGWYRGDVLAEPKGTTDKGEVVYKYPLRINPIRNFSRKHAALLFGEVPDTPNPLVKHLITAKSVLYTGSNVPDDVKQVGLFHQHYLNELWSASHGRSVQFENGLLSQFLGGSIFEIQYRPWVEDTLFPIFVKGVVPDFFLPIWSADDPYNLLEAYEIYRAPAAAVHREFNISAEGQTALVMKHWTRDRYSILIDGKPLEVKYGGERYRYQDQENPFGIVPFVYIPRWREGNFYGSSMVEDVSGLVLEYNARFADLGDAVRKTVHRKYVGKNIMQNPKQQQFDNGEYFTNIGTAPPGSNHEPDLSPIDAPSYNEGFNDLKDDLWGQLNRDASLGPIAFGEDEGSQRSALTLAFRMWPSTTVAKMQRTFWTDGLNQVAHHMIVMGSVLGLSAGGSRIDRSVLREFDLSLDWLPMIPRDREAQVNEIILRLQAGAISLEKALEDFGDVPDIPKEVERIEKFMIFQAKIAALSKPKTGDGSAGSGAATQLEEPIASVGLSDN